MFGLLKKREPEHKRKLRPYKRKSTEEKANELLAKSWYQYLQSHPQFAMEIAKQKFGITGTYDGGEEEPPDLADQIRNLAETNKLLRDSFAAQWSAITSNTRLLTLPPNR
jgi:hypothetical protein